MLDFVAAERNADEATASLGRFGNHHPSDAQVQMRRITANPLPRLPRGTNQPRNPKKSRKKSEKILVTRKLSI